MDSTEPLGHRSPHHLQVVLIHVLPHIVNEFTYSKEYNEAMYPKTLLIIQRTLSVDTGGTYHEMRLYLRGCLCGETNELFSVRIMESLLDVLNSGDVRSLTGLPLYSI